MNARSFKVIFSKRLGALVAVGENATSQGKGASGEATHTTNGHSASSAVSYIGALKTLCMAAVVVTAPKAFALDANALPSGGEVRHGAATVGSVGATMTINQTSSRATINWQSFNVGSGAKVNIVQPSSSAALLNRVVGNEMSQIHGQINANGQVVLVNPNGVLVGSSGSITASAFTATTFGISDADFNAGNMRLSRNGSSASVVNQGTINTQGDYVALIGASVSNSGTISTSGGNAMLGAGDAVSIPLAGNIRLELAPAAFASVDNSGTITTAGGQVFMRASAVVDAVSKVANATVTHSGTINTSGGRVDILADHGTVRVSGTIVGSKPTSTTSAETETETAADTETATETATPAEETSNADTPASPATTETNSTPSTAETPEPEAVAEPEAVVEPVAAAEPEAVTEPAPTSAPEAVAQPTTPPAVADTTSPVVVAAPQPEQTSAPVSTEITPAPSTTVVVEVPKVPTAPDVGGSIFIGRDETTNVLAAVGDASGARLESVGGFVETSGSYLVTTGTRVIAKDWLLDPTNITIAASGPSGTTYSNDFTAGTNSTVLASDINASLNAGTSVTIATSASGPDLGNIAVNESINKTGGGDATLTLKAHNNISVAANKSISSNSGKLNVVFHSDSDGNGEGGILMNGGSSIVSNSGNITFGGGATSSSTNSEYAQSVGGIGVNLSGTTINAGAGKFTAKGKSGTAQGVLFSGTNNITAAHYTIDGQSTNGAAVYMGNGTTTFTSTGSGLASSIKGTSQTGRGVFIERGTLNFNANNGSNTALSSGQGEMRLGWNKGVTLNTNGDVTLGSHATGLTFQADAFATGKLTLKGQAAGGGDGIYFTEGAGSGARIMGTNATVLMHGISTGSGRGVILQPAGVANSISTTGTGSIEIIGESATGSGVRVGGTTITSGGLTKITGVSKGGTGDGVTSTGVVNAGSIDIQGTAVGGRGVVVGATHTATSGDVYIDGKSTNNIASEVSGAVNANGTNANITLLGTSQTSVGIQLASTLTAKNLVTVTGESKANTTGTFITGTSGVDAASYQVKGTSATATGINIDGGTTTFRSSSNAVDSLIEGKGAAWGIQKRSGTLNLTNDGNKNVTMQSSADSTGGGLLIGSADGLTVNTKGNVTIGSTNNNALLALQRTIFNANGGNLSLKGKSASNGITMQDGGGNAVQIVGTNGANISLEGESSGVGTGVHFGLNNSAIVHNISTNGTVTLIGKSANGFGVNTHSSTVTGSTVNIVADTLNIGSTSTINAGTLANPGTGLVTIKTATSNREILIGADDVTTSGSQRLGLSQVELDRIRAANLVIGDASSGNITVSGAATTAASTGKITLQTGGSIAVNAALTVSNATGIKHLTLDAVGAITNSATGKLTAQDLTLKAGSTIGAVGAAIKTNVATANLTSAGNQFLVEDNNVIVTAKTTGNGNINITTTNGTMRLGLVNGVSGIDAGTGNVNLKATSDLGHGIDMPSNVKGKDITVDAKANNGTGLGFYGAGGSFTASGTLDLTGTATGTGNGFYSYGGTHTAQTGINITGTSANGQGVGFDANVKLINTDGDILIKGTASDLNAATNGANAVNTQGIGLRGVSIENADGKITLEAVKGQIFADTGNPVWGVGHPFANTITQNGTGDVKLTTVGNGHIHVPLIVNNGAGNVIVAAGSDLAKGNGGGGQVKTAPNNSISQNNGGTTYIYSGKAAETGALSILNSTLSTLKVDGTATQNADTNAAFGAGTGITGSTAKAQAIFREKLSFVDGTLTNASFTKIYGDASTANTGAAATTLLGEAKAELKTAAGVNSTVTVGNGTNNIVVSKSAIVDTLTDTLTDSAFSNSGFLKANPTDTYKFAGMSSTKYDVGTGIDVIVNVTPKAITLGGITAENKVYDGSTSATVNTAAATFNGMVTGDNLSVISIAGAFDNKNVGTGKTVTLSNTLGGADLGNYTITDQSTTSANVTPKAITLGGITAENKVYDGSTSATVNTAAATFNGMVTGDNLSVISSAGTFDNKNVGTGKTVTLSNTLGGADLENYTVTNQASTTGSITPRPATISATPTQLTFTGTPLNQAAPTTSNLVDGDDLTVNGVATGQAEGTYRSALAVTGGDAGNYTFTLTNADLVITAKPFIPPVNLDGGNAAANLNGARGSATLAAGLDTGFQLASAEQGQGQCTQDTLSFCECETAKDDEGLNIDGVQLCFEPQRGAEPR